MKNFSPSLLGLCVVAAAVGCSIEAPDFAGKSCDSAADCPSAFSCVAVRPGAGRTCEVLGGPGVAAPSSGPVPTWCKDIRPVLAASCVASCHGTTTSGSGRTDFRLDLYEGSGSVQGARQMASRVQARAVAHTMPPQGNPAPSEADISLIDRWASGEAPLCDGAAGDGGTPTDGGTPRDGGP